MQLGGENGGEMAGKNGAEWWYYMYSEVCEHLFAQYIAAVHMLDIAGST